MTMNEHADHALVTAIAQTGRGRIEYVLCTDCRVIVAQHKLAHQAAAPAIPTTQEGNPR